MARPRSTSSFDRLLADLVQVVAEMLLIREPRVQTAAVSAVPEEPPPDLLLDLISDTCPYCPGGSAVKSRGRLAMRRPLSPLFHDQGRPSAAPRGF